MAMAWVYICANWGFNTDLLYSHLYLYWLFLANIKIGFNQLFKVVLLSDFVFVLAGVIKLVILVFSKT